LQNKCNSVAAFGPPSLARAGGLGRLVNRTGANIMHGKTLEMRMGPLLSFAKAGDRQMTQTPNAKMKRLSQQRPRPFTFYGLGCRSTVHWP
jgi:hypothetical protein